MRWKRRAQPARGGLERSLHRLEILIRHAVRGHLPPEDGERVDVSLEPVLFVLHHFGRHPAVRARLRSHQRRPCASARESKVAQGEAARRIDEHVVRFDVAMDDLERVKVRDCRGNLAQARCEQARLDRRKLSPQGMLVQFGQRALLHELGDKDVLGGLEASADELDDVRVVRHRPELKLGLHEWHIGRGELAEANTLRGGHSTDIPRPVRLGAPAHSADLHLAERAKPQQRAIQRN
mmetsp:Transcript_9219/g.15689  ORF Transcript_9219/g.15689 Transcript_9219/m.15689 type:complete len:237 (-) Transcript_9219:186-896(-)